MPPEQRAIPGDTLMDVRNHKMFRFMCQIETLTAYMFKGHYLDEPAVIVERCPRHLRELTELERQNVQHVQNAGGTNLGCTNTPSSSSSRDVECEGCDKRMSVVNPSPSPGLSVVIPSPSPGQGEPASVTPPRVSQGDLDQTTFFTINMDSLQRFVVQHNNTVTDLKTAGRCLGLVVTTSGRGIYSPTLPICGRIAFGLKSRAIKALNAAGVKAKKNLFKFDYHSTTGFYQPSEFCESIFLLFCL